MSRSKKPIFAALLGAAVAITMTAAVVPAAAQPDKVTLCHKPGTPDEETKQVTQEALPAHLAHGDETGPCQVDEIIDADGIATPDVGTAIEVTQGDPLASFPVTNPNDSGLDMFDNDGDGAWTLGASGDDLHAEGTTLCPTASRNAVHDLGDDCKVLDIDSSLTDGQAVDCDLEFLIPFTACPTNVRYHDSDADGAWDSGEDIVLDVNDNGVFD